MESTKRIALVTGANKGLGFQTAKQLAEQDITVLLGCRDESRGKQAEEKLQAENLDVTFLQIDVASEDSIIKARNEVEKEFSRLDILVNNAGIMPDLGIPMAEVPIKDIVNTLNVNVVGPMATIKYFLPLLKKSAGGRIVNVSSGLGSLTQNADPNYMYYPYKLLAYNSSKAALNSVTLSYAFDLKGTNIKINSADPGYCATDLNGNSGPRTPEQGAAIAVKLATIPNDGPHGGFFDDNGIVPW